MPKFEDVAVEVAGRGFFNRLVYNFAQGTEGTVMMDLVHVDQG